MIGDLLFQIQTTYRIYRSEKDRTDGMPMITTSDPKRYEDIRRKSIQGAFNGIIGEGCNLQCTVNDIDWLDCDKAPGLILWRWDIWNYRIKPLIEHDKLNSEHEDNMDLIDELKEYFENTSRSKVLEDWEKTAEYDDVEPKVLIVGHFDDQLKDKIEQNSLNKLNYEK